MKDMRISRASRHQRDTRTTLILLVLSMVCAMADSPAQSTIFFKSGASYECRVIEYQNGIFTVELPDKQRRKARQEDVERILFDVSPRASPHPQTVFEPESSADAMPEKVSASVQPRESVRLTLAPNWESRIKRGSLLVHRDVARLLSRCGTPQVDLDSKDIVIWKGIRYLMPLQEAKKALGLGVSSRIPVTCAAFPPNSFFYHTFSGIFDDGFPQLHLVTDYADRVVGIQWQDNASRQNRWFLNSAECYSQEWSYFNYICDRRKATPNWYIGAYVCQGNTRVLGYPPLEFNTTRALSSPTGVNEGIIRIDTELFSVSKDQWGVPTDEKSRERVRLLLAQPVVDLMLYVVQKVSQ